MSSSSESARQLSQRALEWEVAESFGDFHERRDDGGRQRRGRPHPLQLGHPPVLPAPLAVHARAHPWLYRKGISAADMGEALQALIGANAANLSAGVVLKLKEEWGRKREL